ncbi:MAG: PIN domain-containing protein [Rhizobiales bacterium]|nr:PIN domain-containing protein [Hyphomicrobiales bacterium]
MEWLDGLWKERAGRISAQVLAEFFNVSTQYLKPGLPPERALLEVAAYQGWQPLPTSVELLLKAAGFFQRFKLSWWDSIIVASAVEQGCTHLLTEDMQHGQSIGSLTIINPFHIAPQALLSHSRS